MAWHGYIGLENLALNASQRQAIIASLRALGKQSDPQPAKINHWRPRLDNQAAIVETEFSDNELTVDAVKSYLANAAGVDPSTVNSTTTQTQYGPMLTLSRSGTDYIRLLLFGGVGADWETSRQAVLAYLAANLAEWEPVEP